MSPFFLSTAFKIDFSTPFNSTKLFLAKEEFIQLTLPVSNRKPFFP